MWLLSTDRAELHQFISPEVVPGGYAILSHVWGQEEQSFRDTQRLQDECITQNVNPRDRASSKIRDCCVLAERHGYDWLWVDAPCIDKSSSAELSEAINAMYQYYSHAEVCYAYLYDVPPGDILDPPTQAAFKRSKWHQRGWTLQELIASRIVIFLSQDWCILGTKAELADLVESVTQIPASLLRLETQMAAFSVAQRMSWAANRQTTRLEDEAYCLLGIFGIQMPPLYGEGRQSFYRLQEEIMKRFPDTTLFAWRPVSISTERTLPTFHHHEHTVDTYLFAPSPNAFCNSSQIQFLPSAATARRPGGSWYQLMTGSDGEVPSVTTFSVTPYGVLAHIPVIELSQYTIAILFWHSGTHNGLGLRLNPCPNGIDPSHLLYDVHPSESRIVPLGLDEDDCFTVDGQPANVVWKKVYIAHRPPPDSPTPDATTSLYIPLNLGVLMPFRLPGKNIQALYASTRLRLASVSPMSLPWTGSPPITLAFRPDAEDATPALLPGMDLHLGRCTVLVSGQAQSGRDLGPHWARLLFHTPGQGVPRGTDQEHSCAEDHVGNWPENMKVFEPPQSPPPATVAPALPTSGLPSLVLWFTPCPLNPSTTLVVNIDSEDQLYRDTIQGTNETAAIEESVSATAAMDKHHAAPVCMKPKKKSRLESLLAWVGSVMICRACE